jgi:hypothetical protein
VTADEDIGRYCRAIEAHLCRRNDGHLVRVVGPAFDLVSAWARRGVPLRVAFRGIDRTVERRRAGAGRRRPVRIEFCEADVLDAFDDWRRSVGPMLGGAEGSPDDDDASAGAAVGPPGRVRRTPSLTTHLDRALVRLTSVVAATPLPVALHARLAEVITELDGVRQSAPRARGEARAAVVARLAVLDDEVLDTAVAAVDRDTLDEVRREAVDELAAYRARMARADFEAAVAAAARRLLRDRFGLPRLALHNP